MAMKIGAQLYTVRDHCKTLDSLSLSLKKIAEMGYRYVQLSGTCDYDAAWMQELMRSLGLICVLTHTPAARLTGDIGKVIADHDAMNCRCVGLGMAKLDPENLKGSYEGFLDTYRPVIKALSDAGHYFMYHNHDQEFRLLEGQPLLYRMAEDLPESQFGFTVDTYWVQRGGEDPARCLERLAGRIPCIHLKDYAFGAVMSVVGEGNINFPRIFKKAEQGGTQFMLVEQDDCGGEDPFECLKRSLAYLRAQGFGE